MKAVGHEVRVAPALEHRNRFVGSCSCGWKTLPEPHMKALGRVRDHHQATRVRVE